MRRPGFQLRRFWALALLLGASAALAQSTTDYDSENNNLIDITTLAQFNAIRWDLDGNGTVSSDDQTNYAAAFPNPATGMGCGATCAGYELKANLNFDTGGHSGTWSLVNGVATSDPGDDYHNDGTGFAPIGTRAASFNTTLDGNGYTISNLFINHAGNDAALFAATGTSATITALGLSGAHVRGGTTVAPLAGLNRGRIAAVWASGRAVGDDAVAGLVGSNSGTVVASYSTASVTADSTGAGLVGGMGGSAALRASYSIGHVRAGTAVGFAPVAGTVAASYWDTDTSGVADDGDSDMPEGRTTTQLQQPTASGASGLYATWDDEDVDGDGSSGEATDDDAWDFGTTSQYPALKFGGLYPPVQRAARSPVFGSAAVTPPTGLRTGEQISAITVTAATGGGTITYSADGLPPGLSIGTDACATARTICGAPTRSGTYSVTVYATNAHGRHALASFNLMVGGIEIDADASTDSVVDAGPLDLEETPGRPRSAQEYTVRLTAAPNAAVTVTIASADTDAVTVDDTSTAAGVQDTLTFTTTNWSTGQTVTARADQDRDARDESVEITHTAAGGGYDGVSAVLTATVGDSDTPALVIDADPRRPIWWGPLLALNEDAADMANSKSYTVRLATEPSAEVVVAIANGDATAVTLDRSSLTFTAANWRAPQTVTATAQNDADDDDAYSDVTHTASGASEYEGVSPTYALRITVSDDERTGTDYDTDEDNLIEVATLAQLNAVRWDRDGDGAASAGNTTGYGNAFPGASTGMGCRSTCIGYELAVHLDFDTDGDGDVDANDPGSYTNWSPIAEQDSGVWFQGNGLTIRNLKVNNSGRAGLFDNVNGFIYGLGVVDADVRSTSGDSGAPSGILAARTWRSSRVIACWSSGTLRAPQGGGLVGGNTNGIVAASFSTARVIGVHPSSPKSGGLVAYVSTDYDRRDSHGIEGKVIASYATGNVSGGDTGGFSQNADYGEIRASYQTGTVSGSGTTGRFIDQSEGDGDYPEVFVDNVCAGSGSTAGDCTVQTLAQLRAATPASGAPYSNWVNLDLDDDGTLDGTPWDFGTSGQRPVISYPPLLEPDFQRGDFDTDDNGLIEVSSLAQLNAMRWDLNGDGTVDSGVSNANTALYVAAFSDAVTAGCPDTDDADTDPGPCIGYELTADLDFDTDGDDSTHTSGTGDSGDAYYNSGAGWVPIGTRGAPYTAVFDGNGHVIDNLFVNRATTGNAGRDTALFSATGASAVVTTVGLPDAHVTGASSSVGALIGRNGGRVAASWATGAVAGTSGVGGLVGTVDAGSLILSSYSAASVTVSTAAGGGAGLVGWNGGGTIRASYSTGAVTGTSGATLGGFNNGGGTVAASYWDTTQSGIADDQDSTAPEGLASNDLRSPTDYTGVYAAWDDEDVDGDGDAGAAADYDDDAWDFGDEFLSPVLKFGGFDTTRQFGLQPNVAPTFSGSLTTQTVQNFWAMTPLQIPAATGGEGSTYTYEASGLPAGLSFDADATGMCGAARTICGTPSGTDGDSTVTVHAHDGDANRANSDRATLTFTISVVTPTAAITATTPASLTEATLDGATVTVTLTGSTFASGVTASSFTLTTGVPGLNIDSATAVAGGTEATLTLDHNGQDFDTAQTLGVTVLAAAHNFQGALTTLTVPVATSLEATATPANLSLNEAAGSTNDNTRTFTAVLQSAPASDTAVDVVSADAGAVMASPSALTFTTTDWSTAQTVTVTAQQDDDSDNESTTVTLWASGVGALARVTVMVADDDLGAVLVNDAADPAPLAMGEGDTETYSVRLSAQPTGDVAVDVASGDAGAVSTTPASLTLTFTTHSWSSPRTVLIAAQNDSDALDESVTITHTATGGGYGGTSTELRVAVSDGTRSGTDYDADEDGLIEISTLAQLNAVRWDLDGNGAVANTDQTNYNAAFPSASAGMGCPAVSGTATCTGYELMNDLDFDTDGDGVTHTNGTGDSGDSTYYNSGAGFAPIGNRSAGLEATFDGNGHVIYNLFVNRTTSGTAGRDTGLFGAVGTAGVVRNVGVADAWVSSASDAVGALVGRHYGRVEACWTSGSVTANSGVGGLAGSTDGGSAIVAGYSTASVTVSGSAGGGGGLAGWIGGDVAASYATGAVTGGAGQHGLANGNGAAAASYWDTEASGVAASTFGAGRTTMQLQSPTSATGPYAGWDRLDVDGDDDHSDAPWDFGTNAQYPALRVGPNAEASVFVQRGDYDLDDDGLIDVHTLAQLNAVRWDMDGDGAASSGNAGAYRKAFRHHRSDMGCPAAGCAGFELMNDLDFDTDGDKSTHTNGTSDSGDAYHNGGSGWDPIGAAATTQSPPSDSTHFNTVFDGGGHVIHNLFIDRSRTYVGLFGALRTSAVVRGLGLRDVWVDGGWSSAPLAGQSWGRTAAVWASGTVEAPGNVGGLVGWLNAGGTIVASYSTASVECTDTGAAAVAGGLAADAKTGSTVAASYSTGAVTGNCPAASKGGLLLGGGTVAASYWDTTGSGINDDNDADPPEGRSRADLRSPTGYTGIYADWDDQDVDGDGVTGVALDSDDDAWNFGDAFTHPVLKYGGLDTTVQFGLQPNLPPTFSGTLPNVTVANGHAIDPIQAPTATGGEGVGYSYSASGLPTGLVFDADGTGTCQQARTICGTPGTDEAAAVTVYAHDGDVNIADSDRGSVSFTLTVVTPTAAITASNPAALTEATLDGATVTVTLTNSTFASGVGVSGFQLNTGVPGLSVSSVTATGGGTAATLTLAHTGADFDSAETLGVTVLAAAHALKGDVTTATVNVATSLEATASPANLPLQEAAGSTMANEGTFTAVLQSAPAADTTVAVASLDQGAATVDPAELTFTTTDWSTAQTVTVTAQQDDDADNESTTVTLTAAGVGVLASVTVTVADDDLGTVLVDADPTTDAVDPGPLLAAEGDAPSYAVRLSAQPTGDVTVDVASDDAGAVATAAGSASLTFTTADWSTAQTVQLAAPSDADALDESATLTHTATGGGYGGTSTELRVAVSDTDRSGTDYDTDEDGLIEISSLAQLNAVRWDLDGGGSVAMTDQTNYNAAFPSASASMGCPAVSGTATCTGYELVADLDFDTDGDGVTHTNGTGDSGDATYYNSGAGFAPIGNRSAGLEATFDGNGHVIYNLFVNRTTSGTAGRDTGLFGAVGTAGVVRNVGVADAWVSSASDAVGALVGRHYGRVEACWTSGSVTGNSGVGGLAGSTDAGSAIVAGHSSASVTVSGSAGGGGGLVGWTGGDVAASYATGAVTGGAAQQGLAGGNGAATASYWDLEASGLATSTFGAGRTTSQLQNPTSATGPFASWGRLDLDGDDDPSESPWDFGTSSQYPALNVGSNADASVLVQRGDYDLDDDGLIDVYSLAHLNAIRWDLDGDGDASSGNAGTYRTAFRHHRADMGCPSTCIGYELRNDLDFDTDGDRSTHTGGTSDSGDAYHNSGSGWDPIGPTATSSNPPTDATHFTATFDGGGHVVHNLFINRTRAYVGLFAALRPDAEVRALGLRDAWVDGGWSSGALAGQSWGRAAGVWLTGTVEAPGNVGALVGVQQSGALLLASYSTASVECTSTNAAALTGGLVGDNQTGAEIAASYSTGAVTGMCPTASKAGFANGSGQVGFSYWDTTLSGISDDQDSNAPEGRTTVQLQMPTGYAGLYGAWDNYDVDGDNLVGASTDADDDAWEFGLSNQHPVLKFGGLDTALQFNQQPDLPPSFTASAPSDVTAQNGRAIAPIQIPAAGAGNGAVTIAVSGLPAGLSYDADGSGACGAERTICGTPSGMDGDSTVTVTATDADDNTQPADQATLTFTITVATPSAAISATSPAALTENNLNGATVTVALTNTTFVSGVAKSSFTLDTNVPGLSIDSVATVASGDASATLTLDYDGTDFDTARTLGVTVAASAHALAGSLATATVGVAAGVGVRVAPPSLSLEENPAAGGGTNAHQGSYSVVLESQPSGSVTVTATSADAAVHVDTDLTPLTFPLTFTTASWGTAQSVTAAAQQDADAADESVQVTHAVTGYPGVTTAAAVTVAVDDDETAGIVIDANPATAGVAESGPAALNELPSATNNTAAYTVRLSAPPTQTVTVTATSADAGAVTVDTSAASGLQSMLTFTSTNWGTGQEVTLAAQQDLDGVNESVAVTHAATTASMSEYTNVSASLTVTVADDEAPGFVFDSDPSTPATDDAAPLNLDELAAGTNSDSYSVRLSSQPTQDVTVAITSPDTDAVTVGTSALTFTTSNWRTAQTVAATAVQDLDGANESVDVSHAASTATNSEYTGITGDFEVAVDDDETPAITLSPTSLNVNEELSAAYTVALATQPTGAVTVSITGAGSGISANPTSLAFTSTNWATARTVTVNAADDQNSVNEQVTLTHTAAGASEYDTLTADLEVTALDNDTPSLRVDPTALTVPEADSRTYTIRLNTQPSATVTVTVSGAGSGITVDTSTASGDQNALTFTANTWETNQTVTVSAAADDNGVDEAVSLSHAAAGGDYGTITGAALPGVSVTADDGDTPAVLLDADPTTGNVDEAGPLALQELASGTNSDAYTVRLATEPTETVTVTVTSSDTGAVTVGDTDGLNPGVQNTLTFTALNWDTRRTVTVAAAQDDDGVDETAVVTNAAATAGMSEYGSLSAAVTVTVDDDETPGFAFDAVPSTPSVDDAGPLNLDELPSSGTNSASYTVRLATEPKQTVTVTVTSDDAGAVSVGDTDGLNPGVQNTLTFTSANWSAPQAVALTAQQDLDGADESVDIGHAAATSPASEYTGVSADFRAAVDDDETPGITLSPASLTVGERDSQTYAVVLDTEPVGGSVTVSVTGAADGIAASPARLVFSASNWSTARTVRVRAADDQNSVNEVVTLSHAASGADYGGVSEDLEVTAQDDDTPSLRVRPTALTVREDGSATYRIRLNTEPSAAVTVTVGGTTAEVTVDADRDTVGNQTSLTFTDANWRAERTVAVSAAPDDDATDEMVGLTHAATGGDYTGLLLTARPGVSVTVDDDDEPAVLIDADPATTNEDEPGPLALNELSGHPDNSKGYTVRLATEPTATVEVTVASGDRAVTVDTGQTPLTRTLTFTALNWSAAQTVTATAAEDPDASNERVELSHAADGGDYGGVSARLFATTVDDDEPALVVDAAALVAAGVAEGGSAIYTVRLETEPAGVAAVSIAVTGGVSVDADGDQAGLQRSLRFDAMNWNVARTVLVRGLEDDDAAAGMAALRHTSSGADYGRAPAVDVPFAVNDDDTPAVVVDQTAVAVNEGASAAYLVMLATAPSGGAVTVALSSSDAAAATVSPAVLRFTAGDWERPRRVTVRGEPDGDSTDGSATVSHSVSGGDYGAVTASPVAVAVRDSEAAGVRVEPPRLTVREGGTGRYRVRLNTEPAGDVTVTATGGAELSVDSDETPQERSLTFTTGNWGSERTVTVEAARDDGSEDGSLTVSHAVSGYAGVATAPALQVQVEDGDEPGFTFDPEGGLSLSEEPADPADAMGAYSVRLATQPLGAVAVEVSSDDAGVEVDTDGTPRTLSLSFDATNWATGQSVSVRAVADADEVGETASLLHTAAGGGYGGVSGTLRVRVSDDDRPPAPPPPPPPPPENRPPVVVGSLADLDLDVGESASVRLGGVFADDGPLSHWAESSDGAVASARVEGNSMLRVRGLSPGAATVTVWAADVEGQRAQLSFRVSVGRVLSFDPASASAPEGGTLRLRLSLSRPAGEALRVSWTARPDGDAATADADAADVSALSGTAEFAAGRTEAFIDLEVRDDAEIEPAREVLRVELSPPPEGANWALGRSWALLWVEEGVCDRSPVVRDALRGSRECSAPTSSDLSGRGYLGLHRLDLPALRPKDFLGLTGLRVLHLHGNLLPELPAGLFEGLASLQRLRLDGNRLPSLPEGTLAGLGRLKSLRLDGNRLESLPANLLLGASNLERLDLGGNLLESLPPGLFAGAANLDELNLDGNPGAPFALVMRLIRTDAAPWEPGPAWVSARVEEGAPFAFSAALAAENAELSAESTSVPAGATSGAPMSVAQEGPGAARLSLSDGPALPAALCGDVQDGRRPCFRGLSVQAGPALLLFKPPPSPTDEPPTPALSADGDRASLALDRLFSPAEAGDRLTYETESNRPDLLSVRIVDGGLVLEANEDGDEGTAVVTVTATDPDGPSATLSLTVQVEFAPVGAAPGWRLEWLRTLRDADQ